MGKSGLTTKLKNWKQLLNNCRPFDVEEGETYEYMYAVRESTSTLTIWTQQGWKEGWWIARIAGIPSSKTRVKLDIERGNAPNEFAWTNEEIEAHLMLLLEKANESR